MGSSLLIQLKAKLTERRLSIPKLAALVGIPKDRIYKWYQEGTHPKPDDSTKLWNWINGEIVPHETNAYETNNDEATFLKKYISVLEENIKLKEDLKNGVMDTIQKDILPNLTGIVTGQMSMLAHLSVILDQDAERDASYNPKKAAEKRQATDKRIAAKLSELLQKDKKAADRSQINK